MNVCIIINLYICMCISFLNYFKLKHKTYTLTKEYISVFFYVSNKLFAIN